MLYRVHLQNFEGPLDLLLFLINKNEVDIHDIPIAEITKQYMAYLEVLEWLDLENAGDFILMAATLIRIKAQMLLPRPELDEDEEAEDPRQELVMRLLEYQRFKEVAEEMSELESRQREFYPLAQVGLEFEEDAEAEDEALGEDVSLFNLMAAFVALLKRVPPRTQYTVERVPVTVDQQAQYIIDHLNQHGQALFTDLFRPLKERITMIVTFVALLELVKRQQVRLEQNEPFSEIWLSRAS